MTVRRIIVLSSEDTHILGKDIGQRLNENTFITLTGDLGTGKTAFVRGLAQGLDIPNAQYVTSPTYTLINQYTGRLPLYHVDLYRLDDLKSFDDIGLDEILDADGAIAIEWADKYTGQFPSEFLSVHLEFLSDEPEDTSRRITLTAAGTRYEKLISTANERK